jgi:hypothetical protein
MRPIAVFFAFLLAGTAFGQAEAPAAAGRAQIQFSVADPQREPFKYALAIFEDGAGSYTASAASDGATPDAPQSIQIRNPVLGHLFETARAHKFFAMNCADTHNRVAFTGQKTFAYSGPDGSGSCTFNYSKEQALNQAAADLMAIAYTLTVGTRLESEHLHDRLGLDAELESLQESARDQRALEMENIAPVLEAIANDDAVMERARARARALLPESPSVR